VGLIGLNIYVLAELRNYSMFYKISETSAVWPLRKTGCPTIKLEVSPDEV